MSESVIADFVATFNSEASARAEPTKGRILLSEKRLVLAADQGTVTIPLSSIVDVAVGQVPEGLGEFFNSTVTVAFERNGRSLVAAVEADDEKIAKFSNVLFKAVLNGTDVTIRHPSAVGGRVTGAEFEPAKLFVQPGIIRFRSAEDTFDLPLSAVTAFDRRTREVNGVDRSVIAVRHVPTNESLTALVAGQSSRKLSILGRYLRLEYSDRVAELEDVTLSDEGIETLAAIYSGGSGVSLSEVLDLDDDQVSSVLADLRDDGLLVDGEERPAITYLGRIVVHKRFDTIDA